MRIVVGIISGIVLKLWQIVIKVFLIVNFIITIFTGKRNKELAHFSEIWNTQMYQYLTYMTFRTNKRPFPFTQLKKSITTFEK